MNKKLAAIMGAHFDASISNCGVDDTYIDFAIRISRCKNDYVMSESLRDAINEEYDLHSSVSSCWENEGSNTESYYILIGIDVNKDESFQTMEKIKRLIQDYKFIVNPGALEAGINDMRVQLDRVLILSSIL